MSACSERFLLHQEVACVASVKAGGVPHSLFPFGFFAPFTALVNILGRYTVFQLTYLLDFFLSRRRETLYRKSAETVCEPPI